MKIAINATHLTSCGGLTYLNKIIEWLGRLSAQSQFILLGKKDQKNLFIDPPANFIYDFSYLPGHDLSSKLFGERLKFPEILKKFSCDLIFEPGNYATKASPWPKVTLIHNLSPFDNELKKQASLRQKISFDLLRKATLESIRTSDGIIFLSSFAQEMISHYADLRGKMATIIYHGTPENYGLVNGNNIMRKFSLQREFILCVSHIYRHKKILELVRGYKSSALTDADLPPLVIAGDPCDREYNASINSEITRAGLEGRVRLLGKLETEDLRALYHGCKFFMFPSVLENCPIILLEALGYGCPILCSNSGVMLEICNNSAMYFNPLDVDDIREKILEMNSNNVRLNKLREKSRQRAKYFGWEKTARQTLAFFGRVLEQNVIKEPEAVFYEMAKI